MSFLEREILRAKRRYEWFLILEGAVWGFIAFLCVLILMLLAERLLAYKIEESLVLAFGALVILASGILYLWLHRLSPAHIATKVDERFDLRERVSSAYYLRGDAGSFSSAVMRDAERHLRQINSADAFRYNFLSVGRVTPIPLIVLILVYVFLPPLDLLGKKEAEIKKAEQKRVLIQEAKKLETQAREMLEVNALLRDKPANKVARDMVQISREINSKGLTPRESLARLSNLSDRIREEKKQLEDAAEKRSLGAGGKKLPGGRSPLQRQLREADVAKAAEQIGKAIEKIKVAELSGEQSKEIAKELQELSSMLQSNPELAKALAEAAKALSEGKGSLEEAAKSLQEAAKSLEQLAELIKQLEQLEAALKATEAAKAQIAGTMKGMGEGSPCPGCGELAGHLPGCPCAKGGEGAEFAITEGDIGAGKAIGAAIGNRGGTGPEWGIDTTNLESGGYDAQKREEWDKRFSDRSSDWQEEFVQLYDARSIDSKTYDTKVKGKRGEGPAAFSVEVPGKPVQEEPKVDMKRSFLDYRESQKDAIAKERIPQNYKEYVKSYFDSLEMPEE